MNRTKQLEFCKRCENQKFDSKKGIICSLTNETADFMFNDFKDLQKTIKSVVKVDNLFKYL